MLLNLLRSRISHQNRLLLFYHKTLAFFAALFHGFPGRKLKIIAVTGTNGKTTTCNLIAKIFEEAGYKIGLATTINFKIGDKEWVNDTKQTTLGRFRMQKLLKKMLKEKCGAVVLEVTSHALNQSRITGIKIHSAVLTNITADHIEYHGSFEAYRSAKMKLFENKPAVSVLPLDDPSFPLLEKSPAKKKITYSLNKGDIHGHEFSYEPAKTSFILHYETPHINERIQIECGLQGELNAKNALAAAAVAMAWNIELNTVKSALAKVKSMPGRYELIDAGQPFTVVVDYAHTPDALESLCKFYRPLAQGRLIIVFGATGGGRDKAKRPKMAEAVDKYCDIVIITDDDPYSDDRWEIIEQVASGIAEKTLDKDLFKILGRREAMEKALEFANPNDIVLIAGKGCEPIQIIDGKKIPWDDRKIAREIIREICQEQI